MRPQSLNAKRTGFTLIELLVVIAVIGLLAAILFPVFARVREKARQTSCASNLRQLGLAFSQYSQDYDEVYYYYNELPNCSGYSGYNWGWGAAIYPYARSKDMFRCPSDTFRSTSALGAGRVTVSYGANFDVTFENMFNMYPAGAKGRLARLNAPSKTVLLFEVQMYGGGALLDQGTPEPISGTTGRTVAGNGSAYDVVSNCNFRYPSAYYNTGPLNGESVPATLDVGRVNTNKPDGVHTAGSNFLFCDGHVKWLRGESVSPGWPAPSATSPQVSAFSPTGTPAGGGIGNAAGTANPDFSATFSPT